MEDPENGIHEYIVRYIDDDGISSYGCDGPANAGQLEGKIAIIDRGVCEFGLKALNAQEAGAIGCIIVNN